MNTPEDARKSDAQALLKAWAQSDWLEQPRGVVSLASDYLEKDVV